MRPFPVVSTVTVFSPAKLNLYLAVTGRRADGFHDLVSVAAPLAWGDELTARPLGPGLGSRGVLVCDDPAVPVDESNLVLRAAELFATVTAWTERVHFTLRKRIPMGAGLGGGSSNAVAALRALNRLAGEPLDAPSLAILASRLGSDCALFLADEPVVMRGRGERVEVLGAAARARLTGRRVLVFKPAFGVATAWAYRQIAAQPAAYIPAAAAEAHLAAWRADAQAPAEALLANNLETVAFAKHLALPTLLGELRAHGATPRMSGSGSACYALLPADADAAPLAAAVRAAWGASCFVQETTLA
ncbi:MAG: 4-(cytidine 5'-diphospho)-2-C-methyl-D-erythritol kinase [Opitutaceae bacterium]|nr:4-(cytidine 5'-diphospho)-2-C-methyl-D-erythritol kinase [Opitutaceae bacterium]